MKPKKKETLQPRGVLFHELAHKEAEIDHEADAAQYPEGGATETACRFCGEIECWCPEYEVERDKYGL